MRAVVGLLGLLITLGIVGVLVRQQMKNTSVLQAPVLIDSTTQSGSGSAAIPASGTAAQQSQQIQQQFKQALDQAVQTRPVPDDTP